MHIVCAHVHMYVCVCDCVCTHVCAHMEEDYAHPEVRVRHWMLHSITVHLTCLRQGLSLHGSIHLCQAYWSVSSWVLSFHPHYCCYSPVSQDLSPAPRLSFSEPD